MIADIIAKRYAGALYAEATAVGSVDALAKEIGAVAELLKKSEDFSTLVKNPLISREEKQAVIDAMKQKGMLSELLSTFMTLLNRKNRLDILGGIASAVTDVVMSEAGQAEALVEAAAEMDDATRKEIETLLSKASGLTVSATITVDESIIGGIRAMVKSTLYDASVKGQLARIGDTLMA